MKHSFILGNVTIPRPNIGTLMVELRIWESTAVDSTLQSADVSVSWPYESKTHVEGKTPQELLDRIKPTMISQAQAYINKYKKEKQLEGLGNVTDLITDIDGTLSS